MGGKPTSHPSIYHCLIFKIDRVTLWPFLPSLILLPNRHFQRKHQLLVPTSCCSFYTSNFRLAWISSSLWDCLLCSPDEQSDDCEMWENASLVLERFLADYHRKPSGSAMEGTVYLGGERWLRDVGTVKSRLVLERWCVDHRLRAVVIGGDKNEHDTLIGKDLES